MKFSPNITRLHLQQREKDRISQGSKVTRMINVGNQTAKISQIRFGGYSLNLHTIFLDIHRHPVFSKLNSRLLLSKWVTRNRTYSRSMAKKGHSLRKTSVLYLSPGSTNLRGGKGWLPTAGDCETAYIHTLLTV